MAQAVRHGACAEEIEGVEVRLRRALEAGVADLEWADGVLLGTPENFGYMSGALKDFLDRTYYPCEGKLEGVPLALFVSAGNDGTGALAAIRRIALGYGFREVQEPVIARGEVTDADLARCEALGMALAAGLEIGAF